MRSRQFALASRRRAELMLIPLFLVMQASEKLALAVRWERRCQGVNGWFNDSSLLEVLSGWHAGSTLHDVYCKGVKRGNKLTRVQAYIYLLNPARGLRPQGGDHDIPS